MSYNTLEKKYFIPAAQAANPKSTPYFKAATPPQKSPPVGANPQLIRWILAQLDGLTAAELERVHQQIRAMCDVYHVKGRRRCE